MHRRKKIRAEYEIRLFEMYLRLRGETVITDYVFALRCVSLTNHVLWYCTTSFLQNRTLVLAAIQHNGLYALQYTKEYFGSDAEMVKVAVKRNGLALQHVTDDALQGNREIVMAAVKQNGLAIQHAPSEYHADVEVVTFAIRSNPKAMQYVPESLLLENEPLCLEAVQRHCQAYEYLPKAFQQKHVFIELYLTRCHYIGHFFEQNPHDAAFYLECVTTKRQARTPLKFLKNYVHPWCVQVLESIYSQKRNDDDDKYAVVSGLDVAKLWVLFGKLHGGYFGGVWQGRKACFMRALKINPRCAEAWAGVGNRRGGMVLGNEFDEYSCYRQALEYDKLNTNALQGIRRLDVHQRKGRPSWIINH
eukprot:PhF_6_TR40761/c0_g1_i1/m.61414